MTEKVASLPPNGHQPLASPFPNAENAIADVHRSLSRAFAIMLDDLFERSGHAFQTT